MTRSKVKVKVTSRKYGHFSWVEPEMTYLCRVGRKTLTQSVKLTAERRYAGTILTLVVPSFGDKNYRGSLAIVVRQTQLSRLKEQTEQEADERQSVRLEESRSQEQARRLQWQVRELEEELADMRRKESESSQRKQDMVCCSGLS